MTDVEFSEMNVPFLSLVLPVYNVQSYVERCVNSIIFQNYDDYEVILVDDGSTDESGRICDMLAEKYEKITALHKENGGLSNTRNYGLEYAAGEYVVFIDSDDWVADSFLRTLDAQLKAERPDVLKYGYQRVKNGILKEPVVPYYESGRYLREDIEKKILSGAIGPVRLFDYSQNAVMSACSCAYSVSFLKSSGIRFESEREILNEDYLFNATVLLNARCVYVTHDVLYLYDYREGSLSKRYVTQMLKRKCRMIARYRQLLEEKGLFEALRNAYYAQCVDSFYACCVNECGAWADKERSVRNIRQVLHTPACVEALKQCSHFGLGPKGTAIYWLMRLKQAKLMYFLYCAVKKAM